MTGGGWQDEEDCLWLQNYPGRLHKLFLVGLPRTLHWTVDTIKPVLHPQTMSNIRICDVDDLEAPLRAYLVPPGPESPQTPTDSLANGTVSTVSSGLHLQTSHCAVSVSAATAAGPAALHCGLAMLLQGEPPAPVPCFTKVVTAMFIALTACALIHHNAATVMMSRSARPLPTSTPLQDTESDWATPRSTMTLPDLPSVSPIPELEFLACEPAPVRTHVPDIGRRRVFIPDMPITPVSERRCSAALHFLIQSFVVCAREGGECLWRWVKSGIWKSSKLLCIRGLQNDTQSGPRTMDNEHRDARAGRHGC